MNNAKKLGIGVASALGIALIATTLLYFMVISIMGHLRSRQCSGHPPDDVLRWLQDVRTMRPLTGMCISSSSRITYFLLPSSELYTTEDKQFSPLTVIA